MTEISIRPATAADVPAVRDVLVTTWHDTYDAIYGLQRVNAVTADWHSADALGRLVSFGPASLMIAVRDGKIIATATARMIAATQAKLDRLYVLPSAQGHGIGTRLMRETLSRLPDASTVVLEVEPQNRKAVDYYRAQGFSYVRGIADCCRAGSGIPADLYQRALPF